MALTKFRSRLGAQLALIPTSDPMQYSLLTSLTSRPSDVDFGSMAGSAPLGLLLRESLSLRSLP